MSNIRKAVLDGACVTDGKEVIQERSKDKQREIEQIRKFLRDKKVFDNPFVPERYTNLAKSVVMSERLVNFTLVAEQNIARCIPLILKEQSYKVDIVHATKQEEEEHAKIENHSIEEIKEKIEALLKRINDRKLWNDLYKQHLKINGKLKSSYIEVYHQINAYIENSEVAANDKDNVSKILCNHGHDYL